MLKRTIRRFGITSKYKGYFYIIDAVPIYLKAERTGTSVMITKDVYQILSERYKYSNVNSIERDIRTVINICWDRDKCLLESIAGYPLNKKPTNSEFLDILAFYIMYR